jgi:phage terminase large subunit-like protein
LLRAGAHTWRIRIELVTASRGKAVRAEPVVSLYEQGLVHHVGLLPQLEDQLCGWNPAEGGKSPDRLDALVWALTDLSGQGGRAILLRSIT